MRLLNRQDVERLLTIEEAIEVVQAAHIELSAGRVVMPVRMTIDLAGVGEQNIMPAWMTANAFGLKSVTFFPTNTEQDLPLVIGLVLLLEHDTGRPLAVLDGTSVTATRTAAASAVATRVLANQSAATLALIGAGVQAQSHLAAMLAVRPIEEVRVAARTVDSAARFVAAHREHHPGVSFKAMQDVRTAVEGADIICTVTLAAEPVLAVDWLASGCHINAVGSHSPTAREIDSETMKASRVVVDSRDAALTECGDCMLPIKEGHISAEHVSDEIGEVLADLKPGRTDPAQTTIYQSCGLAVQDVAVSRFVYEKAVTQNIGLAVDWPL